MKYLFLFFSLSCVLTICKAQDYTPLQLTKRVFSRDTFPEIKKYSIGEYNGQPNGKNLSNKVHTIFSLLGQNSKTAVVDLTITDSSGKGIDTYVHLKKDTIWKICAFRALSMTGIIAKINDDLSALTQSQVDSIIASPYTKSRDNRMFKSKEDYRYMLGNTSLTLALDSALIAHFKENQKSFEALKNKLLKMGIKNTAGLKKMLNIETTKKQLRSLFIDNVYPDRESNPDNLNFFIGGILDNTVGFLYIRNKKNIPMMDPSHFIMVKEIGNGWYLYKTT
jgi:hypothetical protein